MFAHKNSIFAKVQRKAERFAKQTTERTFDDAQVKVGKGSGNAPNVDEVKRCNAAESSRVQVDGYETGSHVLVVKDDNKPILSGFNLPKTSASPGDISSSDCLGIATKDTRKKGYRYRTDNPNIKQVISTRLGHQTTKRSLDPSSPLSGRRRSSYRHLGFRCQPDPKSGAGLIPKLEHLAPALVMSLALNPTWSTPMRV